MIGLIGWGRFFRDGQRVTVPNDPPLWELLRSLAKEIFPNFDMLQLPPDHKVQGGNGPGCDGYEAYDWRDLGTKHQQGSIATRYGILEDELALIATAHAYGVQVYGDLTLHQMGGDQNGYLKYLGADGKTLNGRGAKTPGSFRGHTSWNAAENRWNDPVPPFAQGDSVPVPADDFPFGRETAPENSHPKGQLLLDMIDMLGWKTKRLGTDGYRFDDTKGTNASCARAIMDSVNLPFYSEYFDGNPANLNQWATSAPMDGRSAVEDFSFHWSIQAACNGFDARQFFNGSAYWRERPDLAVVFVDNPDTDTSPGQQVIFNKALAYAFMLNVPCRMALVYGKDYMPSEVWPGAYGLKHAIDNLCWISRTFAFGGFHERWSDKDVFAFTRDGDGGQYGWSGGLLVAGNFNTLSERTITVATNWSESTWLHDYTGLGLHPDLAVGPGGILTITLRSNAYSAGMSYVAYAPGGVTRPFVNKRRRTMQTIFGQTDLDVLPVIDGLQVLPQAFYPAVGEEVRLTFKLTPASVSPSPLLNEGHSTTRTDANGGTGLNPHAFVQLDLAGPDGKVVAWTSTDAEYVARLKYTPTIAGAYSVRLVGSLLPAIGAGFELTVDYVGGR